MTTTIEARRTILDDALASLDDGQKSLYDLLPIRLRTRFGNLIRSAMAPDKALEIVCNGDGYSGIGGYWDTLLRAEADAEY